MGLSMLVKESLHLRILIRVVASSAYKCVYLQHCTAEALICTAWTIQYPNFHAHTDHPS